MYVPIFHCRDDLRDDQKLIALTFDDGPSHWTEAILDVFEAHGGSATFFVLGSQIEGNEEYLQRMVREGHEVGNHTFTHHHLGQCDMATVRDEIQRTAGLIASLLGESPTLLRCPYGQDEQRVARIAGDSDIAAVVHWSITGKDWKSPPAESIIDRVLPNAVSGAVVVLHDGLSPEYNGWSRFPTAQAVREIVPRLIQDGFELVTVSELMAA